MTPDNQLRRTPATTETHCQVKCILIQLKESKLPDISDDTILRVACRRK
jgi:hypothetical protein